MYGLRSDFLRSLRHGAPVLVTPTSMHVLQRGSQYSPVLPQRGWWGRPSRRLHFFSYEVGKVSRSSVRIVYVKLMIRYQDLNCCLCDPWISRALRPSCECRWRWCTPLRVHHSLTCIVRGSRACGLTCRHRECLLTRPSLCLSRQQIEPASAVANVSAAITLHHT